MTDDFDALLVGLAAGGAAAMLIWYALGVLSTWLDEREDDAPNYDYDEREPR